MKKILLKVSLLVGLGLGAFAVGSEAADAATLYRAYNPNTGEHLYTANGNEIPFVVNAGWRAEGNAWEVPAKGTPVYRVFNPNNGGDHHYTLNRNEVTNLTNQGWRDEGIAWQSGGSTPVHRLYNPNAKTGTHHFTTDVNEKNNLVSAGWKYEGVAMYSGGDQGTTNPTNPTKPVEPKLVWTVWLEIDNGNDQSYVIKEGSKIFGSETEATNWIDNYADNLPFGVSASNYGVKQIFK
ncbi:hypothetical protein [Enterococcus sp. AZ163]|uniref:hypothetical protein n=1 Tax=Enterococcus sp. AZ163 TaxID=2774638 RepID=UPI003D2D5E80